MTTSVRFFLSYIIIFYHIFLSYDTFKLDFIAFKMKIISRNCIVDIVITHSPQNVVTCVVLVWPHTSISSSANSRGAVVSYWRKYVHKVLVNHLGGLSLPGKNVVSLTNRPDMTLDVYHGHKTTTQQQHNVWSYDFCYSTLLSE